MTEDRFLRAFRELDAAVQPDPAFADRLFAELVGDLGLRTGTPVGSRWSRRLRDVLRVGGLPAGRTALRLAYLAAVVGLLLALLAGALLVANRLFGRPSAPELVRMSLAAYADPPPVRFTLFDGTGSTVISSDGHGTWRSEPWDVAAGAYYLYDGARVASYDPTLRTWRIVPVEDGGPPFPFNAPVTWVTIAYPGERATMAPVPCEDATDLGEAIVVGRVADGVECPGVAMQYWIDRETRLVLRAIAGEESPFGGGAGAGPVVTEVSAFETVAEPDSDDFAWSGPVPGVRPAGPVAGTALVVGARPPAWSGTTIEGTAVATTPTGRPAVVLLFGPTCGSCVAAVDDVDAAVRRHPRVDGIAVGLAEAGTIAGFARQHPTALPVVADPAGTLVEAWGIGIYPLLVLLDREGTIVDVVAADLAPADLERVIAALEAGTPIPAVQPEGPEATPSPSGTPGIVCTDAQVSCLEPGVVVPAWAGPSLGGGTFGSGDIVGRPAVLWFDSPALCDGPCPDWVTAGLREFGDVADRYGDRATPVLVVGAERMPGDTERLLEEAGVSFRVVFDWDGAIADTLRVIVGGVVVMDADGRIAAQAPGPFEAGPTEAALARLLEPSPSP